MRASAPLPYSTPAPVLDDHAPDNFDVTRRLPVWADELAARAETQIETRAPPGTTPTC